MGFQLQTKDFIRYFQEAREVIAAQRDYVTELDSTTGDGDHWVNVNMGFEKITALSKELEDMTLDRKSTRLNSSHSGESRMPSSA